jgi:hypothetical protein
MLPRSRPQSANCPTRPCHPEERSDEGSAAAFGSSRWQCFRGADRNLQVALPGPVIQRSAATKDLRLLLGVQGGNASEEPTAICKWHYQALSSRGAQQRRICGCFWAFKVAMLPTSRPQFASGITRPCHPEERSDEGSAAAFGRSRWQCFRRADRNLQVALPGPVIQRSAATKNLRWLFGLASDEPTAICKLPYQALSSRGA